jgi:hypothetical protein
MNHKGNKTSLILASILCSGGVLEDIPWSPPRPTVCVCESQVQTQGCFQKGCLPHACST